MKRSAMLLLCVVLFLASCTLDNSSNIEGNISSIPSNSLEEELQPSALDTLTQETLVEFANEFISTHIGEIAPAEFDNINNETDLSWMIRNVLDQSPIKDAPSNQMKGRTMWSDYYTGENIRNAISESYGLANVKLHSVPLATYFAEEDYFEVFSKYVGNYTPLEKHVVSVAQDSDETICTVLFYRTAIINDRTYLLNASANPIVLIPSLAEEEILLNIEAHKESFLQMEFLLQPHEDSLKFVSSSILQLEKANDDYATIIADNAKRYLGVEGINEQILSYIMQVTGGTAPASFAELQSQKDKEWVQDGLYWNSIDRYFDLEKLDQLWWSKVEGMPDQTSLSVWKSDLDDLAKLTYGWEKLDYISHYNPDSEAVDEGNPCNILATYDSDTGFYYTSLMAGPNTSKIELESLTEEGNIIAARVIYHKTLPILDDNSENLGVVGYYDSVPLYSNGDDGSMMLLESEDYNLSKLEFLQKYREHFVTVEFKINRNSDGAFGIISCFNEIYPLT